MNRRDFLKHSTAAAASIGAVSLGMNSALALWPELTTESAGKMTTLTPRKNMRKAVKFSMITVDGKEGGGTIKEKFALLKSCGFDGIDMDGPFSLSNDEIVDARDSTGLPVCGVVDPEHWGKPLSDPDPSVREAGVKALEQSLRNCKLFGGSTVLLVPAIVNALVDYGSAYQRSQAEIRKVLPLAQELGIRIAIENVWNSFLLSPLEAARYVDEFESEMIGWHFDVGNIINYGWPEQWIHILGKRILKLDVKEYSRKKRDNEGVWKGFDVELMQGDDNWPVVMKALDDVGFTAKTDTHGGAWASAEIAGGGRERMLTIAQNMDQIFSL